MALDILKIKKRVDAEGFPIDKHGNRIAPDGIKYYSHKRLFEACPNAHYYMIYGERSSGKTYDALKLALEEYAEHGTQFAYIRRWDIDIKGKAIRTIFNNLAANGEIKKITKGEYNEVYFYGGVFYFSYYNAEKGTRINSPEPIGYVFALNNMEHDKSSSYPRVNLVIFDEFLARQTYLVDEFVLFSNVLSTIIRKRDNVKVMMLGNTVNKFCPYFKEMGLSNVKKMVPGEINVYKYGDSGLTVAVEYTDGSESKNPSDVYFAFNNPKLQMITSGAWELDIYPHCPIKYRPKDIKYTYFIEFDDEILQCEIIKANKCLFTFIHQKTTPIKDENRDLIYTQRYDPRRNWRRVICKPYDEIGDLIWKQFQTDCVYYQDNEVGDMVMNYINWCKQQ